MTHALLLGSPAIDSGDCAGGTVEVDQRGVERPQGNACDIGAFESEGDACAPADLNCDGVVDVDDLFILLAAWGECGDPDDCPADLDGNGVVDVDDLFILLANWG